MNKKTKKTNPRPKAYVYVVSGPGGAGKTTVVNRLFRKRSIADTCLKAVTVTTRQRRPGEKDGRDYFFVSSEEFIRLKKKKFFLETQKVAGNYYGTPQFYYQLAKHQGTNLLLCIDVKGGMNLKKKLSRGVLVRIFIGAPSEEELVRRMEKRSENKSVIAKRRELAKKELQYSRYYDYVVTNKKIEQTVRDLEQIITSKNETKDSKKKSMGEKRG